MEYIFGVESDGKIILSQDESNHLINVKRTKDNEHILVTDGKGNLYTCELLLAGKKNFSLNILDHSITPRKRIRLHIAISPTKNIDRIEWFLEKATETGIDEISFIRCRHSERKEIKEDRLIRIMIAAMKQSKKTLLPQLHEMTEFRDFIQKDFHGSKLICATSAPLDATIKNNYSAGDSLLTLIGPEGDFHNDELELADKFNFKRVSLGKARLRTETAALNVCTVFNFVNL